MNKKTIIIAMLALVTLAGQAQKEVIWEKPKAFMGQLNGEFTITKVELKQTETVLHLLANYRPGSWIRFAKESFLLTPDGTKYTITGGAKTNEKETDLTPDSLFWMPESGMAYLALHFKPVPLDTKEMDFLESYKEGDFKFWNICDGTWDKLLVIPDEWGEVLWHGYGYNRNETLPVAKIDKGVAKINVRMIGYKKGMGLKLYVGGFKPLGSKERFDKEFPFADDGTLTAEVPLWLTREVKIGVEGLAYTKIIIAPGQETNILMDVDNFHKPFVDFKGCMARTNLDLEEAYSQNIGNDEEIYLKVKDCKTKEERMKCLTDIFDQRVADIKAAKYKAAAKDLLCMEAEANYVQWTRHFAFNYSQYGVDESGRVWLSQEDIFEKMNKNQDLLPLSDEEQNYTWKYLNEPGSPCSLTFWDTSLAAYDKEAVNKNPYNNELKCVQELVNSDNENFVKSFLDNAMEFEDCKNVVREYLAEQHRVAEQLAGTEHVFYKTYDDVAPEIILQTILDKYKGKTVLIDIWATWCGPCRAGHKAMAPWKEELKGKNIQFVYLTPPSSPLKTWQEMIKDIDGDHYYLTREQYEYILNKYESDGIPTYAIYDSQGNQTFKHIGFSGLAPFKEAIEKTLK